MPPSKLLKRFVTSDRWLTKVQLKIGPVSIRMRFCPNKLFGRWNAVGSDDLRDLVSTLVPLILQEAGHCVTRAQEQQLQLGNYRLHEVHVAYAFALARADQQEFVTKVGRVLALLHPTEILDRGIGVRVFPRSRVAEYLLYSKLHETMARGRPRMAQLFDILDSAEEPWSRATFGHQLGFAAAGPRLEIRLRDKFFRPSGARQPSVYDSGRNWVPDTAHDLFCAKLQELKLPGTVRVVPDRGLAEARLAPAVLSTFVHWANGEDLGRLISASTRARHQRAIVDALNIDIRVSAAQVFGADRDIEVGSVLNVRNIVAPNFDPEAEGCADVAYNYATALGL